MATDEISGCVRGVRAPVVCDTGARTVLSGFPAGWEPPGWVTANSTSPVSRATSGQLRIGQAHRISIATTADTPPQVDHTPKCSWIWQTAIDPSPTADATLFTEPLRTSPAANTPGWLVSSIPGWRWGQRPRVDRLALALHHLPGLSAARRARHSAAVLSSPRPTRSALQIQAISPWLGSGPGRFERSLHRRGLEPAARP